MDFIDEHKTLNMFLGVLFFILFLSMGLSVLSAIVLAILNWINIIAVAWRVVTLPPLISSLILFFALLCLGIAEHISQRKSGRKHGKGV